MPSSHVGSVEFWDRCVRPAPRFAIDQIEIYVEITATESEVCCLTTIPTNYLSWFRDVSVRMRIFCHFDQPILEIGFQKVPHSVVEV